MTNEAQRIPTLLTLDVHDLPGIDRYIERSAQLLSDMGIPATYFVPAQIFEKYATQIKNIRGPHQVASHGLFDTGQDDYRDMPRAMPRDEIRLARKILSAGRG